MSEKTIAEKIESLEKEIKNLKRLAACCPYFPGQLVLAGDDVAHLKIAFFVRPVDGKYRYVVSEEIELINEFAVTHCNAYVKRREL